MPTQMVVLTVPLWFLLLLGYVWGMMVLLLVQYMTSGHTLLNRKPAAKRTIEEVVNDRDL